MRARFTSRRQVIAQIEREIARMRHYLVQKNPFFPDLLNQPDFLVVPEVGRLVALYVYTPRQRLTWRSTLAIAEDLFEAKLVAGESTLVAGVLVTSAHVGHADERNYIEFLTNLFDVFVTEVEGAENTTRKWINQQLELAAPREDLFDLWRLERERVRANAARFEEQRYVEFIDEHIRPRATKAALIHDMQEILRTEPSVDSIQHFPVRSPKEPLARMPEHNVFRFDFGLISHHIQHRTKAVEIAVLDRYGSREKIRYLMTKARFISYEFADARLIYRGDGLVPILMIEGNISGPSHDPYRYVKALVSVGWELEHAQPAALRKVIHADI
jgi:hypothetical protein